jgi:hypothetical protein
MSAVTDPALPASTRDEVASGLAEVAAEFADEMGSPPTLAEFLDIVGWAVPTASDAAADTFVEPLRFTAYLAGNKRYQADGPSRVGELDDHLFEDARAEHLVLVDRIHAETGAPVPPQQFAAALLEVLRTGRITLSDVSGGDIRRLVPDMPKKRGAKPTPGDVVAIPARQGGYHLGVVVAQNRFGTALGLFDGIAAHGRVATDLRRSVRKHPVYTDDGLIKNGTWQITDHDESLLELFPRDPEIYHQPGAWPSIDTGEFGAAEPAEGPLRLIDADEAREVGLPDGSYRQVYPAAYLQKVLDDQTAA